MGGATMTKKMVPAIPDGDLRAVSLQVELNPIEKEDLPVSVIQVLPLNEVQVRDDIDFLSTVSGRKEHEDRPVGVLEITAPPLKPVIR